MRPMKSVLGLVAALFLACLATTAAQPGARYDLLIKNGRVMDGTGNPWFPADVAIKDGRIAAIGQLRDAQADRVIE